LEANAANATNPATPDPIDFEVDRMPHLLKIAHRPMRRPA
jgi:hypothetical protein